MFDIPAIDVHGHYGRYDRGPSFGVTNAFMSGSADDVVRRARSVNIVQTIVSPLAALMPDGGDAFVANLQALDEVAQHEGLLQYVVIDPRDSRTFEQADTMLRAPRCAGIKIHPEEHRYPIAEFGATIFEFAAARRAVILAHSGDEFSRPADFVPFANAFPEARLILAHLGNGGKAVGNPDLQVRAIQASKHGNVWVDTSSARSLLPGLIEWAVGEIGADRILFGTDTPLYSSAMQRARIDHAELAADQIRLILRSNAVLLFELHEST